MVKSPPPISLRLHHTEATARARRLLRRLDREDLVQHRVKTRAAKALLAVREMMDVVEPKLKSMSTSGRVTWEAKFALVKSILQDVTLRGL